MPKDRKSPNTYVNSIVQDIQNHFVREETLQHSSVRIERIYEFEDGAVIKYEWQDAPNPKTSETYNHRFTLVNPPNPNPHKLKNGVIKVIEYGES
jgi:hypothetical protein